MAGAEKDKAKEEAQVARLAAVALGDAREKLEGDLARVKDALATTEEARKVAEEARSKAEFEATRLEVDWTSLLLELGQPRTRCLLSSLKLVRTRRSWRRNTRKLLR